MIRRLARLLLKHVLVARQLLKHVLEARQLLKHVLVARFQLKMGAHFAVNQVDVMVLLGTLLCQSDE